MRKLMLICGALICGLLSAQNWALINPDYKYNYSNDGTDTISDQIFVTQIDTLGVDSFRYELTSDVAGHCLTCDPMQYSAPCYGLQAPMIRTGIPHVLGNNVILLGTDLWIIAGAGSMLIKPHLSVGSSWISPLGGTAWLYDADTMSLFGGVDSVKSIAFSNGDTLLISKSFGLVARWNDANFGQMLIGLDGTLQLGMHLPDVGDYFAHQVGDVFEFAKEGHYEDASCVQYTYGWIKYICMQREDLPDTIALTYQTIEQMDEYGFTIPGPPHPCGGWQGAWVDTVTVHIARGSMMSTHHFNPDLHIGTWPGAVGLSDYLYATDSLFTWMTIGLDSTGRTTMGSAFDVASNTNLFCSSDQDSSILMQANTNWWLSSTFGEGIGLVEEIRDGIIAGSRRHLVGYVFDGDTSGTVHSDSFLLSVQEHPDEAPAVTLHPNPADDHLLLISVAPGTTFSILNLTGHVLLTQMTTSTPEHIVVSGLAPGVYLMRMDGYGPQRFVIAR